MKYKFQIGDVVRHVNTKRAWVSNGHLGRIVVLDSRNGEPSYYIRKMQPSGRTPHTFWMEKYVKKVTPKANK